MVFGNLVIQQPRCGVALVRLPIHSLDSFTFGGGVDSFNECTPNSPSSCFGRGIKVLKVAGEFESGRAPVVQKVSKADNLALKLSNQSEYWFCWVKEPGPSYLGNRGIKRCRTHATIESVVPIPKR